MVNRHTYQASTAVLVRLGVLWQQARPEENRSLWQTVEMPAEISEDHLRVGIDPAAPMPPCSVLPLDWVVAQSAERAPCPSFINTRQLCRPRSTDGRR